MIKTANLVATLAAETGLDFDRVQLTTRRLREAGLFTKENRSPKSPRPTYRDAAHLLVMLMSDQPAGFAEKTIERAQNLIIEAESHKHTTGNHYAPLEAPLSVFQREDHNLIDALEALIEYAVFNLSTFTPDYAAPSEFSVSFDRHRFSADIYLDISESDPLARIRGEKKINVFLHYSEWGSLAADAAPKAFTVECQIGAGVFHAIGQLFARGED